MPAKRTVFEVDPKSRALNKEEGKLFHSSKAAICLYTGKSGHSFAGWVPLRQGIIKHQAGSGKVKTGAGINQWNNELRVYIGCQQPKQITDMG